MVECSAGPRSRRVARIAGLRESGLYVVRIRRCLIILQVARRTCAGGQAVISIHVALGALQRHVSASQGETRRRVIKTRCPVRRGVAALARLREAGLYVVWIAGRLVVLQVARYATRIGDAVVPVHMALRTLQGSMCPGEREACG